MISTKDGFSTSVSDFIRSLNLFLSEAENAESLQRLNAIKLAFFKSSKEKKAILLKELAKAAQEAYQSSLEATDFLLKNDLSTIKTAFNKPHKEALNLLSKIGILDMNKAVSSLDNSVSAYFSRIQISLEEKLKIKDLIEQGMFKKGEGLDIMQPKVSSALSASVKSGRILAGSRSMTIEAYSELLVRTLGRAVATRAAEMRCLQNGVTHVKISSHNSRSWCSVYENKVFSLTKNDPYGYPSISSIPNSGPPFHPNCAHVIMPFVIGIKTDKEKEEAIPSEDSLSRDPKEVLKYKRNVKSTTNS